MATGTGMTDELEAAHLANGRLAAEAEQLRGRLERTSARLREFETALSEAQWRVHQLEGGDPERKLASLNAKIAVQEQYLADAQDRVKAAQMRLREVNGIAGDFLDKVTRIVEDV